MKKRAVEMNVRKIEIKNKFFTKKIVEARFR